jgi:hypothetical protein
MSEIEAVAVGRGARMAHLDTYDFQALGFYERVGYEQFAALADNPVGQSRHFLKKPLS